jgi:fimbrial chaperone protein
MRFLALVGTVAFFCLFGAVAQAASLRVAPISLDLPSGTSASVVRVWNDDSAPVQVQIRVFKWTQRNGQDVLEPTRDVVASPPMTQLAPGTENLIRVVRTSTTPVNGRESYRLLIDQLPDPGQARPGTVSVLVRHAIPLYFAE